MYRLVYLSSASGKPDAVPVAELLAVSRRNNQADGITGMLLHHDGNFLQVLEGQKDAVLTCFDRVARDPRHKGCIVLLSEPVESRLFEGWSMGFVPFEKLGDAGQQGFFRLQQIRDHPAWERIDSDPRIKVLVETYLSSFSDLSLQ